MQPGYVKSLIALLDDLGVEVPRNIRCDQRLTDHLIKAIQTAVDSTQADVAKGNAVAADVMEGKTFSNAEAVNIAGTYVPLDTSDADATEDDITAEKTAYVDGTKIVGTYVPLDTSDADATEEDIVAGKTAYVDGIKTVGTYVPLDTSDADATEEDIAAGKTAYVNGIKIVGTAGA